MHIFAPPHGARRVVTTESGNPPSPRPRHRKRADSNDSASSSSPSPSDPTATGLLDRVRHKVNREGLREQHVANLTTLMHHMLLKGDFERAGRAWALLLRSGRLAKNIKTNAGYLSMDVTAHNRWGIGAELLLRNTREDTDQQTEDTHLSEEAFRAARDYYERLIVQYPVHHQRKGPSATNFYAAMFSLWIYEASQRCNFADAHSSSEDDSERLRAAKERELGDARVIASRLDDVIGAPPLDKNPELLQIRAMVALWLGTLQGGEAQETAFERAKGLLLRSRANGGVLWEGVEHIVEEDDW
ncbi:hypothetical protein EG328_002376 [Venturia inaequalis]|uniref:Uncharacterized protein n=1 Tax=Venturia inaequalis TaxID=5025 RepID=A0A8H3UX14_VENIN|nr:hypothetical protein EG328_002376 [Venturia inaequalis]